MTITRPSVRSVLSWTFTAAVIAAVIYLWPATLGGGTRLVVVSGHSMEPTYDYGDIVVARDGGEAEVGDVVVFAVPEGVGEGILVIHRVIAIEDDGTVVTQGDNRDTVDEWPLTQDDIVGTPLVHLPKLGYAVWYLRQWWVIAVLAGLLTVLLLWPSTTTAADEDEDEDQDQDHDELVEETTDDGEADHGDDHDRDGEWVVAARWDPRDFDAEALRDADAWLDEQLRDVLVR